MRSAWMVLLVLAVAGSAWVVLGPPTLLTVRAPGVVDPGEVIFVVRNPLRDREPEHAATAALIAIHAGRCRETLAALDPSTVTKACANERTYPVLGFSILRRDDKAGAARVHFRVNRQGYGPRTRGNLWLTVARRGGGYAVTGYESWY